MAEKTQVLIIDDDIRGGILLAKALKISCDYTADNLATGIESLAYLQKNKTDLILLDLNLQGESGLDLIKEIKKQHPNIPVLMITAHNDIATAVQAIKEGAFDYLVKPLNIADVAASAEKALEMSGGDPEETEGDFYASEIIYDENSPLKEIVKMADRVAQSQASVLITGESGTGKELIAKRIHSGSYRSDKRFVDVNCAAVPFELAESQFFGHEKGSFTGAHERKKGLFEIADKGTIFLDEIGDMDINMQVKFLRVLQTNSFRRVGSNDQLSSDIRVLAATSKDLYAEVEKQKFREDLFYRLNVISIEVPPLRVRVMDIPLLAAFFINDMNRREKAGVLLDASFIEALKQYDWPGNIRELKNCIERAFLLRQQEVLTDKDISILISRNNTKVQKSSISSLAAMEEQHIKFILDDEKGNKTKAAKRLGISIQTLYNKLDKMKG